LVGRGGGGFYFFHILLLFFLFFVSIFFFIDFFFFFFFFFIFFFCVVVLFIAKFFCFFFFLFKNFSRRGPRRAPEPPATSRAGGPPAGDDAVQGGVSIQKGKPVPSEPRWSGRTGGPASRFGISPWWGGHEEKKRVVFAPRRGPFRFGAKLRTSPPPVRRVKHEGDAGKKNGGTTSTVGPPRGEDPRPYRSQAGLGARVTPGDQP